MPAPISNYPYLESESSGSSNYSSPYSSDASVSSFDEFYYPNLSKRRCNNNNMRRGGNKRSGNKGGRSNNHNNNVVPSLNVATSNLQGGGTGPWYKNQNVILGGAALTGLVLIAAYFAYRMYKQKNEVVNSLIEMNDELNTYKIAYAKLSQNQNQINTSRNNNNNNNNDVVNEQQSTTSNNTNSQFPFVPQQQQNVPTTQNIPLVKREVQSQPPSAPIFKKPNTVPQQQNRMVPTQNISVPTHKGPPPQFPVAPIMGDFMKSLFGKDMFSPMTPPKKVNKSSNKSQSTTPFDLPVNVMIIEQQMDNVPSSNTRDRKVTVEEEFEDDEEVKSIALQEPTDQNEIVNDNLTTPIIQTDKKEDEEEIIIKKEEPNITKGKQSGNKGGKRKRVIQDLN